MDRHTRRRLSGIIAIAVCALGVIAAAPTTKARAQKGVFALIGGKATAVATMRSAPGPGGTILARIRQFESDGTTPILDYTTEMERTMHVIVIRDDFVTFAHLHPSFDATTGTFHQTLKNLNPNHRYYLYANSVPIGMKQQVFRFNLNTDRLPAVAPAATLRASPLTVQAGPYAITLSKTTIPADLATKLTIVVREHGKPARDLGSYLGAAGHAVFIDTATLGYYHVHPTLSGTTEEEAMAAAMRGRPQSGPYMQLAVPPLRADAYKLWLQVRQGAGKVYTAAFTVVAK